MSRYEALIKLMNEAKLESSFWDASQESTEATPEWVVSQVLSLHEDSKAMVEALSNLVSEYRLIAYSNGGFFIHEDHPAWLDARSALNRIQES